jgi:hypothetical protein
MTPTYVTFEQAKLINNEIRNKKKCYLYKDGSEVTDQFISDKFNGNIPAPMDVAKSVWSNSFIERPEQWQVVEWLRVNHSIWVSVVTDCYGESWYVNLDVCSKEVWENVDKRHDILSAYRKFNNEHSSPQEAYSAAFDYVLNNLV